MLVLALTSKSTASLTIRSHFFGISVYTDDQLRHQPCGLNNYWIAGLAGPQSASYSNKSYRMHTHTHVLLENPNTTETQALH